MNFLIISCAVILTIWNVPAYSKSSREFQWEKGKFPATAKTNKCSSLQSANTSVCVDKEQLKRRLSALQYHVTQEKGTEQPFSGEYDHWWGSGLYRCVVCHQPLFSSQDKYDSGCGWPAFSEVLDPARVRYTRDTSIRDRVRTEVTCAQCGAHLGHVFTDGPLPTGKRFCTNSASISFEPADN